MQCYYNKSFFIRSHKTFKTMKTFIINKILLDAINMLIDKKAKIKCKKKLNYYYRYRRVT